MAIKTWASGDILTAADMNTYPLQKGVVTTKGDLLVGTTDSTVVRQAVGANGLLLFADSNLTNGVRYGGPPAELVNIVASAATGTINVNADTAPVWLYTTNASANFTLNLRYSASVSMATYLPVGESCTVVFLNTNGTTAYYASAVQVDGNAVTPKWQGGSAPSAGNASSIDAYTFTIIKTAATPTYTVLGALTKFA